MNLVTVDDYKKHLRKKYKWNECPTKADRVHIPEDIWTQIDWTKEEIEINAALPHKLWNMRHDDNIWPLCHRFRGKDAHGPRALGFNVMSKYKATPPKLVEGRGIARWMARGDSSILEIPALSDVNTLWTTRNFPEHLEVFERKPEHPDFGKAKVMSQDLLFENYGPSALQKFSDESYLKRDPFHISYHKMIKRREVIGKGYDETGNDTVFFTRYGWRWDSLDDYYNKAAFFIGLAWN